MGMEEHKLDFYITNFRRFFKKIIIIYILSGLCLAFLFYKLNTRPEPVYYASSQSGKLRKLTSYDESVANNYIAESKSKNENNK